MTGSKNDGSYDVKADMFSFGVILFEIFHPPFTTYMERAETLLAVRGEGENVGQITPGDYKSALLAAERFPASFVATVPESAQR